MRAEAAEAFKGDLTLLAGVMQARTPLPGLVLFNRAEPTGDSLAEVLPLSLLRGYSQATSYKVLATTAFMVALAFGVQSGSIKPDAPITAPIQSEIAFFMDQAEKYRREHPEEQTVQTDGEAGAQAQAS